MVQLILWTSLPLVSAAVAARTYQNIRGRTRLPGIHALQALVVLVIFWSCCLFIRTIFPDPTIKLLTLKLGYTASLLMPITWLAFAICYTRRQMHLSRLSLNALCFMPVVSVSLAMTNPLHQLVWRDFTVIAHPGFSALVPSAGTWFYVQLVVSAAMILIATTILAYALAQTTRALKPVITVIAAPTLVAAASLYSMSPYTLYPGLDLSSVGFAIGVLLIDRGVLRYGVLETIPLLRDRVLEKLTEGVIVINQQGQIVDINSAALELLTVDRGEVSSIQLDAHLEDFVLDELLHPGRESLEVARGGRTYDVTASALDGSDPQSDIVLVFRDVTTRRQAEQALRNAQHQLERLAHTDSLTGLYNRRYFMQRLREEVERTGRHDGSVSVLLFDLDYFKQINDRHGHDTGDQVLQAVAIAATSVTRVSDVTARVGGEEFAVLLPETDQDGAMQLANRLREAIESASTHTRNGEPVGVTASIGVATARLASQNPRQILKLADDALYRAKRDGRNLIRQSEAA